jgi:hypothetical protein
MFRPVPVYACPVAVGVLSITALFLVGPALLRDLSGAVDGAPRGAPGLVVH